MIQGKYETTKLYTVDQIFMMIKIQQNTSKYDKYEKRIKQKTSIKEERKQLNINLFHSTSFFLDTLKTTSGFQVFRAYKKRPVA